MTESQAGAETEICGGRCGHRVLEAGCSIEWPREPERCAVISRWRAATFEADRTAGVPCRHRSHIRHAMLAITSPRTIP